MILKNDLRPDFCGECRGTMIVFEHWFNYITTLNFQWNVCAVHVNNFSSNLVECIDFSGSSALLWEDHVFSE